MSTLEENKAVVPRYFAEAWNERNIQLVDEIFAPDFLNHGFVRDPVPGPEGTRQAVQMALAGFPDFHIGVEDLLADGDKVIVRFTSQGTHQGVFMGVPATHKPVRGSSIVIFRLAHGEIVEAWSETNTLSLLQQLGAIPAPGEA